MANYSAQYTFGVHADVKNAQSSLNSLSKTLREIQTKKYTVQVDTGSMEKASAAAETLHNALQSAMNTDTGKLNLSRFINELNQAGTSVGQLSKSLLEAGSQGQQAFRQLVTTISSAEAPVKQLNTQLSKLGTGFMNTIKWQAYSSVIHGLMSSISGAISYAKNLNTTLNDIRIVTGSSADEMARFAETANRAAKALSTSTNEFAKASLIYYQQGDSAALAAEKAAITTKAANVAFTASAQEMSEMLTAVWNSYQVGEKELEHTVDVLAKLGATTASSMEEMATGMQKVAATANTVGVSMEQMSAMIATSASVTRQAPQTIGTAWNTILSRIGGLKLGETLEDGTDLNKYSKALQTIGVNILDATGNLRDMGGVIDEIGARWNSLNEAQKSALAQTVGGARQYTQILAFFENFDKYQKNFNTAQNSDGALQEQQEIYAESWEAASKRVQAAMETVYSQLINDKAITQFTDFLAKIINLGTSITQTFGGLGNVLALIATSLVNANIDKISTSITEAGLSIKQLFSTQEVDNYRASLETTKQQLQELQADESLSSSMQTSLQYDTAILELRERLSAEQDKMTAKQKQEAQAIIEKLQASKEYYSYIMQMQEKQEAKQQQQKEDVMASIKAEVAKSVINETDRQAGTYDANQAKKNNIMSNIGFEEAALNKGFAQEAIDKVKALAVQFGVIDDLSKNLTVDKLVETMTKASEEAGRYKQIMQEAQERMGQKDQHGNWTYDVSRYDGSAEDRKQMVMNMAQSALNSSDFNVRTDAAVQFGGGLEKIQNIDPSNVEELNRVLNIAAGLLDQAGKSAGAYSDQIKDMGVAMGGAKEPMEELQQQSEQVGASTQRMADDAATAIQKFKQQFVQGLQKANTGVQAFVKLGMTLTRVTTAFNAVGNAMKTLSDPNVSGWQKFTTVISTFATVLMAVKSAIELVNSAEGKWLFTTAKKIGHTIASTVATIAEAAATGGLTAAINAANLAMKAFMASNPLGWILALVAAIASVVALIASLIAGSEAKWQQNMAERQEAMATAMNDTDEAAKKLQTDLQSLASVMNDTSLSYDEQLSKINEICAAYGVQATMLDILSGNYSGLAAAMTEAARAEIDAQVENATDNLTEAEAITEDYRKRYGNVGSSSKAQDWWGTTQGTNWFTGNLSDGKELEALKQYRQEIEALGFTLTDAGISGNGDEAGLLKLFQDTEELAKYVGKSGSYLNGVNSTLLTYGAQDTLNARQQQHDLGLQSALLHNDNFDIAGFNSKNVGIKDIASLIHQSGAASNADRAYLANYLSGFDHYSAAAQQYQALNTLSGSAATIQMQLHPEITNQEEVSQQILDDLLENDELDIDTLLKINPTDIVLDETTGKYTIDEQARKLAEDRVKIEKAQTRQAALQEQKELMTGDTFAKEDYQTLKDSGLFATDEELQNFMHMSAASRQAMWQEMYDSALDAEISGLDAAIADAEARIPELKEKLDEWYAELRQHVKDLVEQGIITEDEIAGLTDEEVYRLLSSKRASAQQSITTNEETIAKYNELKANGSDEDKKAFAKQLGLDSWDDQKVADKIANIQGEITSAHAQVDLLNERLAEGDALAANLGDTQQVIADSTDQRDAAQFYGEWTQKVDKATKAVKGFTDAMSQQKTMSADVMAELARMDENFYTNYQNMSSNEWLEYSYQQAMSYYDQLAKLYKDDVAMQLEIQQQKKALSQQYYNSLQEQAERAVAAEEQARKEQISHLDNAIKQLQGFDLNKSIGDMGVKAFEQLRQEIEAAGLDFDAFMEKIMPKNKNSSKEALVALTDAKTQLQLMGEEAKIAELRTTQSIIPVSIQANIEPPLENNGESLGIITVDGITHVTITPTNYNEFFNPDHTLKTRFGTAQYQFNLGTKSNGDPRVTVTGDVITGLTPLNGDANYEAQLVNPTTGETSLLSVTDDGVKIINPATGSATVTVDKLAGPNGEDAQITVDAAGIHITTEAEGSGTITLKDVTGTANKVNVANGKVTIAMPIEGSGTISADISSGKGITMSEDGTIGTITSKISGTGTIEVNLKDGWNLTEILDENDQGTGVYELTNLGIAGSASVTISGVPDGTTVKAEGTKWRVVNEVTGEATITASLAQDGSGDFDYIDGVFTYNKTNLKGNASFTAQVTLDKNPAQTAVSINSDGSLNITSKGVIANLTLNPTDAGIARIDDTGIHLANLSDDSKTKYIDLQIKNGGAFKYENGVLTLRNFELPTLTQTIELEYIENRSKILGNEWQQAANLHLFGYNNKLVSGSGAYQNRGGLANGSTAPNDIKALNNWEDYYGDWDMEGWLYRLAQMNYDLDSFMNSSIKINGKTNREDFLTHAQSAFNEASSMFNLNVGQEGGFTYEDFMNSDLWQIVRMMASTADNAHIDFRSLFTGGYTNRKGQVVNADQAYADFMDGMARMLSTKSVSEWSEEDRLLASNIWEERYNTGTISGRQQGLDFLLTSVNQDLNELANVIHTTMGMSAQDFAQSMSYNELNPLLKQYGLMRYDSETNTNYYSADAANVRDNILNNENLTEDAKEIGIQAWGTVMNAFVQAAADADFENTKLNQNFAGIMNTVIALGTDDSRFIELGKQWIAGILQGVTGQERDDLIAAMATAAGQSVEVFKETWGIASPSKVARQLARYFMQGLNLGFGDVKINVGKFSKTILKAITDEMDELLPSAQEKIDETMKQLKIDPNMTDRDFQNLLTDDDWQEIWTRLGMPEGSMSNTALHAATQRGKEIWRQQQEQQAWEDLLGNPNDPNSVLGRNNYKIVQATENNPLLLNSGKQVADNLWYVIDTTTGRIIEDFVSTNTKHAQQAAVYEQDQYLKLLETEIPKQLDGGFWSDASLSQAQKAIYAKIVNRIKEKLQLKDGQTIEQWLNEDGNNIEDLMTYVDEAYSEYSTELENALSVDWASIKQNYYDLIDDLREYDEKYAKETQERWEKVWNVIGKLRKAALTGELEDKSAMELLTKEERDSYMRSVLPEFTDANGNIDYAGLMARMSTAGGIKASDLQLSNYASSQTGTRENWRFLNPQMINGELVGYTNTPLYGETNSYVANRRQITVQEDANNIKTSKYFGDSFTNSILQPYVKEGYTPSNLLIDAASLNITANDNGWDTDTYARKFLQLLGVDENTANTMEIGEELLREILDYSSFSSLAVEGGSKNGTIVPIYGDGDKVIGYRYAEGYNSDSLAQSIAEEKYDREFAGMAPDELQQEYNEAMLGGINSVLEYRSDYLTQLQGERDTIVSENTKNQQLIQKALEAKGDISGFSPDDQRKLHELLPDGITIENLERKNLELAEASDKAARKVDALTDALNKGFMPTADGKWLNPDTGETFTEEQVVGSYTGEQTTYYAQDAATFNTRTAAANQSAWIQDVNSDLAALDTLQKAVGEGTEDVTSQWLSLINTLDMADPKIAAAVQELETAVAAGEDTGEAWNHMTDAILQSGNVLLKDSEELQAYLNLWYKQYEITDANGKALNAASLNMIRYGKAAKTFVSALTKVNKALGLELGTMQDLRQEAKKTGKTMSDLTKDVTDLTDAEREMIKAFDDGYDSMDNISKVAGSASESFSNFDDSLLDAAVNCETVEEAADLFADNFITSLDNLTSVSLFDTAATNFFANADNFKNGAISKMQEMGMEIPENMHLVWEAIEAAGGNLATVDWGELSNTMGVDLSWILECLQAIISEYTAINGLEEFDLSAVIAAMQSAYNNASSLQSRYGGHNGGTSHSINNNTPSSSSSGGGSSEKSKTVKQYKKGSDEKERYHEIRDQLEKQGNLLEKIDKLKTRTYGAKHLKNIEKEIAALEHENELQEQYLAEAQVNLDANRRQIEDAFGPGAFNDDGTLNYQEYMDKILAEYNAAVDAYNASDQDSGDTLALNAAEERYNELKKLLEDYEEDLDLVDTIQNDILENQNKISAAALEGIQYKVTIVTDLNDQTVKGLKYWQDLWEDTLDKAGARMVAFSQTQGAYMANLNALQSEYNELMNDTRLNDADRQAGLKELNSEILKQLEDLDSLQESMKSLYGDTLELAETELEKYTSKIKHAHDVMSDYITMQQLMGLGEQFKDLSPMYEMQLNSSMANIRSAKEYLDILKEQKARIEANAAETGWTDTLKQQWDDVEEHIQTAEDNLLQYTNQALNDAKNIFENSIKAAIKDFDEGIKGLHGSLTDLENDYAYYQEEQGRYLGTVKELFEIQKLTNKIDNSIADSTTSTSKQRLSALKDEIKAMHEKRDLTEYDLKMMELQYKHALALDALEQQKNAKSVVRLTRDENGNYGYQYTANEDDVNKAQQDVDDALQAINELAANRTSEIEQKVLQIEREYRDNLLTIASDTTMSIEQRQERMNELTKQHQETLKYYQEQYGYATSALFTNQEYVAQRFGTTISDVRGQYNTDMMDMIASTKEYATYLSEQMTTGEIAAAFEKFKKDTGLVLEATGFSSNPTEAWGGLVDTVDGYQEAVEQAEAATHQINQTLEQQGKDIADTTLAWAEFEKTLNSVRETYLGIYQAATQAQQALGGVTTDENGNTTGVDASQDDGDTSQTPGTQGKWQFSWNGGPLNGTGPSSGYDSKEAARNGALQDIEQKFQNLRTEEDMDVPQAWIAAARASIRLTKYARGGLIDFTGPAWVDGSSDMPESILNAQDTENMLQIVNTLHSLDTHALLNSITQGAIGMLYSLNNLNFPSGVSSDQNALEQHVQITAEFPNATDHNEIEQAFNDIINLASQYANRR